MDNDRHLNRAFRYITCRYKIDHLRFKYGYQVVNRFSSWKNKKEEGPWCDNINNMVDGRETFSGTTNSDIYEFFTERTNSTTVVS